MLIACARAHESCCNHDRALGVNCHTVRVAPDWALSGFLVLQERPCCKTCKAKLIQGLLSAVGTPLSTSSCHYEDMRLELRKASGNVTHSRD